MIKTNVYFLKKNTRYSTHFPVSIFKGRSVS